MAKKVTVGEIFGNPRGWMNPPSLYEQGKRDFQRGEPMPEAPERKRGWLDAKIGGAA